MDQNRLAFLSGFLFMKRVDEDVAIEITVGAEGRLDILAPPKF